MKELMGKKVANFQKILSGHQGYKMFTSMVREAQIHVSHCLFFGPPNIKHCMISN
jgi:hypothetical protein